MQIQENMKAIGVIPLLTPAVLEKIEAVVQTKPKRPESYRWMEDIYDHIHHISAHYTRQHFCNIEEHKFMPW